MLRRLRIKNLAVIEDLVLELPPGLVALTGETGAGKSLLVTAVGFLLGDRADSGMIRTGRDFAEVEGCFFVESYRKEVEKLLDLELEDGELILRRRISGSGRSQASANERAISAAALRLLGEFLVDFHGQHEHQSLLKESYQLSVLDAFSGTSREAERFKRRYREWQQLKREAESLERSLKEADADRDYLSSQLEEIRRADPRPGEDERLRERIESIRNSDLLRESLRSVVDLLHEQENSARSLVSLSKRKLSDVAPWKRGMGELVEKLDSADAVLEDVVAVLERELAAGDQESADPDSLEERMDVLSRLKRKHGGSIEEVLAFAERVESELDLLALREHELAGKKRRLEELERGLEADASSLSERRESGVEKLRSSVEKELSELDMRDCRFRIQLDRRSRPGSPFRFRGEPAGLSPEGFERVSFLVATNKGEDFRLLSKVASGGEISRIMLSFKTILGDRAQVDVMIFDEIDIGIGGAAAVSLARKLRSLASRKQLICVTHLPVIAAAASCHYAVSKRTASGRTRSSVRRLEGEERLAELARMLSGDAVASTAIEHARELLQELQLGG